MDKNSFCVFTRPEDHREGLFGKVCYHILQILPYLYERGLYPDWDIQTAHYGVGPTGATLPGAFALAYPRPERVTRRVSALEIRRRHAVTVGNDWQTLSRIWNAYFRIPAHVEARSKELLPAGRVLGVHYRGNDKQTSSDDSNPISHESFLTLVREHLEHSDGYDYLFAATDDFSFVEKVRAAVDLPVINLGEVGFHKAEVQSSDLEEKTERAVLDCALLARCTALIETSSALPSFAKLLNPDVQVYRTSASKAYDRTPYFPVAYIPVLPAHSDATRKILEGTLRGDWTYDPKLATYRNNFAYKTSRPLHHTLFSAAEMLGLGDRITAHR